MEIHEVSLVPKTYLLWRKEIPISEVSNRNTWNTAFTSVGGYIQENNLEVVGPGSAIYFTWDEKEGRAEIGIGLPILGSGNVTDPNLSLFSVPESKAYHATYMGSYEGLKMIHDALGEYTKKQVVTPTLVIEEYTTNPEKVPDPKDWRTDVYYLYV